jgi:hypothetical protein
VGSLRNKDVNFFVCMGDNVSLQNVLPKPCFTDSKISLLTYLELLLHWIKTNTDNLSCELTICNSIC